MFRHRRPSRNKAPPQIRLVSFSPKQPQQENEEKLKSPPVAVMYYNSSSELQDHHKSHKDWEKRQEKRQVVPRIRSMKIVPLMKQEGAESLTVDEPTYVDGFSQHEWSKDTAISSTSFKLGKEEKIEGETDYMEIKFEENSSASRERSFTATSVMFNCSYEL